MHGATHPRGVWRYTSQEKFRNLDFNFKIWGESQSPPLLYETLVSAHTYMYTHFSTLRHNPFAQKEGWMDSLFLRINDRHDRITCLNLTVAQVRAWLTCTCTKL